MAPKEAQISPLKGSAGLEKKNLATIREKLTGKLELQLLTLAYIDDLEAQASGTKVKRKATKDMKDDEDDNAGDGKCMLDIPEGTSLGRSGRKYSNWSKKLLQEVLHYVEPSVFQLHSCTVDSVQLLRQLLEFGTQVINQHGTLWTGRYPKAGEGQQKTCSRSYGDIRTCDQAAHLVFQWLWRTHEANGGEACPYSYPEVLG